MSVRWGRLCFINGGPDLATGLSTRPLPLHRMSYELCSDYLNVLGGIGHRPSPGGMCWEGSAGVDRSFIFVLILVRDCISSIYLGDLSGR